MPRADAGVVSIVRGAGWADWLLPTHVQWIAVPASADGVRRAIGEAHRRDPRRVNVRAGWRGHLGPGRVASWAMEEPSLRTAARDREQHPVRAGLAASPWAYPGSSASPQVAGRDDSLVKAVPLLKRVGNWEDFLCMETSDVWRRPRRRSSVFAAMNAPGDPWGASHSPWRLRATSVGRCGGVSRGPRAAALHR